MFQKVQRLAIRFEDWMAPQCSGPIRSLLAYETMLVSTGPRDGVADVLSDDGAAPCSDLRLAEGVLVRQFDVQPAALLEDVSFGDREYAEGALIDVDGAPVPPYPCGILCFRTKEGQVETVEVAPEIASLPTIGNPSVSIRRGHCSRACVSRNLGPQSLDLVMRWPAPRVHLQRGDEF